MENGPAIGGFGGIAPQGVCTLSLPLLSSHPCKLIRVNLKGSLAEAAALVLRSMVKHRS